MPLRPNVESLRLALNVESLGPIRHYRYELSRLMSAGSGEDEYAGDEFCSDRYLQRQDWPWIGKLGHM